MLKVLAEGLRRRVISKAVENALCVLVPYMEPPVARPWVFTIRESGMKGYTVNGRSIYHQALSRKRLEGASERTTHQWLRARRKELDALLPLARVDLGPILSAIEEIYLDNGGYKEVREAFLLGKASQLLEVNHEE